MTNDSDTEDAKRRETVEPRLFLLRLSDRARPLDDPLAIQQAACSMLGEHLGVNRCMYVDVEGDDFIPGAAYVNGVAPVPAIRQSILVFGDTLIEAGRRGETVASDDVSQDPRVTPAELEGYRAHQIRAFIAVMLMKGGRLVGSLAVHSATARRWTQAELELVREVGDRIWASVERARAEAALRESEQRYRTIFETMVEGYGLMELVRDESGRAVDIRYLDANARFAQLIGWQREQMIGRLRSQTFGLEEDTLRICQGVVDSGEVVRFDRFVLALGRWFNVTLFPYGGNRFAALYDDITARKETELKLKENAARQTFLLAFTDRLRVLTEPRDIMRAAAEMLARHLDVAMVWYALVDPDEDSAELIAGYFDGRLPSAGEGYRFRLSETGPGWLTPLRAGQEIFSDDLEHDPRQLLAGDARSLGSKAAGAIPLIRSGRLIGFLFSSHPEPRPWTEIDRELHRDVAERTWAAAERARAEAALRLSEEQLRHAMTLRDEFLAVLSHELRTPLSAILIWSKMLRAGAVKAEKQSHALSVIEQSALAQRKLIEDLLDVSGMISGKLRVQMDKAELGPVLMAAVEAVRPMAESKRVDLTLSLGNTPLWARVDRARLQQVVWNLANNAVKFTPSGGRVAVRLRQLEAHVRIEVDDTGRGISPAFLPHVFERFRQADSTTTRTHGGLGLGLAIARQLVELHGGTIEAKSRGEGHGATFVVELPRIEVEERAKGVRMSDMRMTPTSVPFLPEPLLSGVRVLVVEDEAYTLAVVQWLLEQCGAVVTPAASAGEALATFDAADAHGKASDERRFDVLVSDVGLPEQDGYELLAEVRRRAGGAGLPALALTAYAREEDRRKAMEVGFEGYLAKPVEPRVLVETIAGMVGR
jgi:PAS domain S-box-containing protein